MTEIIIAIIIIGVLAAVVIPSYRIQMFKVKNQEAIRILTALWEAQKDYYRDNGAYLDGDINVINANLAVTIPTPKNFQDPFVSSGLIGFDCSAGSIALIAADDGTYGFTIRPDGTIRCFPCGSSLCAKMGYP